MNWKKFKDYRSYFKSDEDILELCERLGNRTLRLTGLKRSIIRERVTEGINEGKTNRLIARQTGASLRQVQRIRKELLNSKGE